MPNTVPNQKIAVIHKDKIEKGEGNFLQIKKENMYDAYKDLNAHGLALYLYLAANREGYQLAISPAAINNNLGMPESTARDKINLLIEKGYLVLQKEGSNVYDFYEKPKVS